MEIKFSLVLFILFMSIINIYCIGCTTAQSTLIEKTCTTISKNDRLVPYDFCTTSLQAAPASGCASLKGLGMISIRLTRYNLTDTRCYIKQLLKDGERLEAYSRSCLKDCLRFYDTAFDLIKQVMVSYKEKRFFDAKTQVSAVITYGTTCENEFRERPGLVSPVTDRYNMMLKLSAIILNIMNILQPHSN